MDTATAQLPLVLRLFDPVSIFRSATHRPLLLLFSTVACSLIFSFYLRQCVRRLERTTWWGDLFRIYLGEISLNFLRSFIESSMKPLTLYRYQFLFCLVGTDVDLWNDL